MRLSFHHICPTVRHIGSICTIGSVITGSSEECLCRCILIIKHNQWKTGLSCWEIHFSVRSSEGELPVDRSRGLRGAWGSGRMGVWSLGASEPTGGVWCCGVAILGILSAERGAAPTSMLTPIPPGWEKPANQKWTEIYSFSVFFLTDEQSMQGVFYFILIYYKRGSSHHIY